MREDITVRRAWVSGFLTGVAVSGITLYLKRAIVHRRPRIVRDEGTVIPIE